MAEKRELPPKSPETLALLDNKRKLINQGLRPCWGSYSWNDEPRAIDVLRTYVCDIYDCLKEAYSYKVIIFEWEKEIAEEAVSIAVACWKTYNLGTHYSQLIAPLNRAIALHVGHPLRSGSTLTTALGLPAKPMPSLIGFDAATESPVKLLPRNSVATKRKAFVQPLLDAKGWSIAQWAEKAKVSRHTAKNYLEGSRKTYHSSMKDLAEALGVTFQSLPK